MRSNANCLQFGTRAKVSQAGAGYVPRSLRRADGGDRCCAGMSWPRCLVEANAPQAVSRSGTCTATGMALLACLERIDYIAITRVASLRQLGS